MMRAFNRFLSQNIQGWTGKEHLLGGLLFFVSIVGFWCLCAYT